jgi:restriction endonuclease S subunit
LRSREPQTLLPAFLAWQINQRPAQDYLQQAATGSHILNITRAAIESLPFFIPPVEVQRFVVELADAARREREFLNALIANRQDQLSAVAAHLLRSERFPA